MFKQTIMLCVAMLFVAGCATLPPPVAQVSPTPRLTPIPAFLSETLGTEPPEDALRRLVMLERQASIDKNLALLAQLWAEESRIVDGRATTDPGDDYIWSGRAAILDRYRVAVFANPPPPLTHLDDFQAQVTGDSATARHGQDHWRFAKLAGRWWLVELRYSVPQHVEISHYAVCSSRLLSVEP